MTTFSILLLTFLPYVQKLLLVLCLVNALLRTSFIFPESPKTMYELYLMCTLRKAVYNIIIGNYMQLIIRMELYMATNIYARKLYIYDHYEGYLAAAST